MLILDEHFRWHLEAFASELFNFLWRFGAELQGGKVTFGIFSFKALYG